MSESGSGSGSGAGFCYSNYDSQSQCNSFEHEDSRAAYLWSQQSLPSVHSLNSDPSNVHSHCQWHCITTLKGHTSYVSSLTVSDEFIFTGSSDNILLWKLNTAQPDRDNDLGSNLSILAMAAGKGVVKSMVVLADKLFSAHQDHKIRVWKINNSANPDRHQQNLTRLATLPTLSDRATKLLLSKNHVQIGRHKKCTWVHHVDAVSALALSSDETLLYSVSWDRTLKIWRTTDFKCLESISNAHEDAINAVALSSDGDVYTGSTDKKIKLWRKKTGHKNHCLVATLEKHKSGINALAISADGSTLYSGASDRSIVVWKNMTVVGALRGHTKSILCLAVVSDLVCSGSADETIRIWRSYSCLAVLEGHQGPVKCLAGAADASEASASYVIYSGSMDCDIKVWQIVVPHLL